MLTARTVSGFAHSSFPAFDRDEVGCLPLRCGATEDLVELAAKDAASPLRTLGVEAAPVLEGELEESVEPREVVISAYPLLLAALPKMLRLWSSTPPVLELPGWELPLPPWLLVPCSDGAPVVVPAKVVPPPL